MSKLFLNNLIVSAIHGVHDHEKTNSQRFRISLELEVDTPRAFETDNVADAVSYSEIRQQVIDITKNNTFNLLEKLAKEIIDSIMSDSRILSTQIKIEKLDIYADVIPGISLTKSR